LRDEVAKGKIRVVHLRTDEMLADILMKGLHRVKVGEMVEMLGLQSGGLTDVSGQGGVLGAD
ncbi:hypothetical protein JAAARDRAFT_135517, partial [Jaapia argillacea MUCL 33604]